MLTVTGSFRCGSDSPVIFPSNTRRIGLSPASHVKAFTTEPSLAGCALEFALKSWFQRPPLVQGPDESAVKNPKAPRPLTRKAGRQHRRCPRSWICTRVLLFPRQRERERSLGGSDCNVRRHAGGRCCNVSVTHTINAIVPVSRWREKAARGCKINYGGSAVLTASLAVSGRGGAWESSTADSSRPWTKAAALKTRISARNSSAHPAKKGSVGDAFVTGGGTDRSAGCLTEKSPGSRCRILKLAGDREHRGTTGRMWSMPGTAPAWWRECCKLNARIAANCEIRPRLGVVGDCWSGCEPNPEWTLAVFKK